MKKLIISIVAILILIIGIIVFSRDSNIYDCKQDLNCFADKLDKCSNAKVHYLYQGEENSTASGTLYRQADIVYESFRNDSEECLLKIQVNNLRYEVTQEGIDYLLSFIKDQNKTDTKIYEEFLKKGNELPLRLAGTNGECIGNSKTLSSNFRSILSAGTLYFVDSNLERYYALWVGLRCKGSLFDSMKSIEIEKELETSKLNSKL